MSDRDRRERLAEYVAVLRGFGLADDEILAVHGEDGIPEGVSLPEFLDQRFDEADEVTLYGRLHDALAASPAGIDADREYRSHAPAEQVAAACAHHGWGVDLSGDGPVSIAVETPDGETREGTFTYPDSALGGHDYPALVAAVESHLDGLTFAPLTDRDGRWRFVLVASDLLADLRDRYGDRVRVFRRPLLRADQPAAADDAGAEADRSSELAGLAGDAFAESLGTGPRVHRSSRPLETETEATAGPETVVGEGVDEVFETLDADADGPADGTPRADERVDDVATLPSDLDEPTRDEDATPVSETVDDERDADDADDTEPADPAGLVGGGPRTTVVEDGLDDVFGDLEGTNPPVSDAEPDRMAADDVLEPVDERPPDPEPTETDDGPDAGDDDAAEPDAGDAAEPDEPADPSGEPGATAPTHDADEPTTTEPEPPADEPASIADDDTAADATALAGFDAGGEQADASGTEEPTGPATEAADEMDDSADGEPEATPSIDEIELDVDEDDVPDVDAEEATSTAGPLAGGVGPDASEPADSPADDPDPSRPEIDDGDAIDPDMFADPDDGALADGETDDEYGDVIVGRLGENDGSDRGPLGRLAAWLRGLF